jgi:YfiH family protein
MDILHASDTLVVPDWPAPAQVRAVVTTRRLPGNSQPPFDAFNLGLRSGESEDVVQSNRALLVRALGLPSTPKWLRQVHGTGVATFDAATRAKPSAGSVSGEQEDAEPAGEAEADAAVTRERGIVLAILAADCLPILLCSGDGTEIAAIHAGWRGLSAGVIEACVSRMRAPPARLMAWLGPAIGPLSYEVGDEVRAVFLAHDARAAAAFTSVRTGHWLCDLYSLARERLEASGVQRVQGGGFDTATDSRWYSHRRDGTRSGRFASLLWTTLGSA